MRLFLQLALFCTSVNALSTTPRHITKATRREQLFNIFGIAIVASSATGVQAVSGELVPASKLVDELKQVRANVHSGRAYERKKVQAATSKTLEPLRNAMEKNPLNPDETIQPQIMKGHMLELDEALRSPDGFTEYVSKTTKDTYPGGKVERELEEAVETAEDYCNLVDCDNLLVYR